MKSIVSLCWPLGLWLLLCLGCSQGSNNRIGSASPSPETHPRVGYQIPGEATIDLTAQRDQSGGILINGTTNLPDGLKLWIEIPDVQWKEPFTDFKGNKRLAPTTPKDSDVVISGGHIQTKGLFGNNGASIAPGSHKVNVTAYFNGAWQSKELLKVVGDGGKLLRGKIFKKNDPDVIDSDLLLDYTVSLPFPAPSTEAQAIALVRAAVLSTPEDGRSSMTVDEGVKFMMSPGTSITPNKGWSARQEGDHYLVNLDFNNGAQTGDHAIWSVDVKSKKVQYVNKNAKFFSWIPAK